MHIKEIHDTQLKKSTLKWNTYFDIYESHFAKYVNMNPTVLEIGVAKGGSLEMLSKYFVNGEIHGLDINEKIMNYTFDEKNIFCHLGDQGDPKYWEQFNQNVNMQFDVIIDDGSHINSHQILTLLNLWPRLKEGGTYLVEDTHTSYWNWADTGGKEYGGGYRREGTFIEASKELIDFLHRQFNGVLFPDVLKQVFEDLYSVTYYNSVVVFTKKKHVMMEPYGVNVDPKNVF
jgi:hypothetical protein